MVLFVEVKGEPQACFQTLSIFPPISPESLIGLALTFKVSATIMSLESSGLSLPRAGIMMGHHTQVFFFFFNKQKQKHGFWGPNLVGYAIVPSQGDVFWGVYTRCHWKDGMRWPGFYCPSFSVFDFIITAYNNSENEVEERNPPPLPNQPSKSEVDIRPGRRDPVEQTTYRL